MAIKTKETISIQDRYNMIQEILDFSIVDMKLDTISYEICKIVSLAKYYSNFELVVEDGLISYVKSYTKLMENTRE